MTLWYVGDRAVCAVLTLGASVPLALGSRKRSGSVAYPAAVQSAVFPLVGWVGGARPSGFERNQGGYSVDPMRDS